MTYQLPMKEDGTVDLQKIILEIIGTLSPYSSCNIEILQALAAHERAEGTKVEREKCCADARLSLEPFNMSSHTYIIERVINTIRARAEGEKE